MIFRGFSKFAIFYTLFTINYCFLFVTFWYIKSYETKLSRTQKVPPRAASRLKSPAFAVFLFFAVMPTNSPFRPLCLFWAFLFNKYFPPALPLLYRLATLAAPAIFAPFPSIWRHFSPRPILAPVQKFNAIKSASFCRIRDRCCNLL